MEQKSDWLSNWTYPDFPVPENEAARIHRIAELSLEQFPKSEILEKVCELAALITQSSMVAVTIISNDKQIILAHQFSDSGDQQIDMVPQTMPRHDAFCNYTVAGNQPFEVISPATITVLFFIRVSQATLEFWSDFRHSSKIASEI